MQGFERIGMLDDAVDALISPDHVRREFLGHERLLKTLYGAVKPDPAAIEFTPRIALMSELALRIKQKISPEPANITGILNEISAVLDASISGVEMSSIPSASIDLSKIDFEALAQRFKQSNHKNTELEALKAAIRSRLERLIRINKTRANFAEKFEELIESYNAGSRNIEELFEELLKLSRSLSEEQTRHVREKMTEEELVIFDILTRPAPTLSSEERGEVKKVARELLERVKNLLVIDWRRRQNSRARVEDAIKDVLDTGLPRAYDKALYEEKYSALFEHVYESYSAA